MKETEKDKIRLFSAALTALNAIGVHLPNEDVERALKLAFLNHKDLTVDKMLKVLKLASGAKYGVPFRFYPALLSFWVWEETRQTENKKRGQL